METYIWFSHLCNFIFFPCLDDMFTFRTGCYNCVSSICRVSHTLTSILWATQFNYFVMGLLSFA